jgi:pimeloyl-ACP methyl ester carboxylesterase
MKAYGKILSLVFVAVFIWGPAMIAADSHPYPEAKPKVSELRYTPTSKYPYRFFEGFKFLDYAPSRVGLVDIMLKEYKTVTDEDLSKGRKNKYTIIGHSQGGPRVLAYAKHAKDTSAYEYNRIQAVITVSGIDKGVKVLEGGVGSLRAKIDTDIATVYRGYTSAFRALKNMDSVWHGDFLYTYSSETPEKEISKIRNMIFDQILPQDISKLVKPIYYNYNPEKMGEIRDMVPGSDFITQNVCRAASHTYKVFDREEQVWHWTLSWIGIPYYWYTYEPVYKFCTEYEDVPVFPRDLPVGFIVGGNANSLSMTDGKESAIRGACKVSKYGMALAGLMHVNQSVLLVGLFKGSIGYAQDCFNAAGWFGDIDGQLNELKGSPENDGFVAKENQFIQKNYINPNSSGSKPVLSNVVGSDRKGYKELPDQNHHTIQFVNNEPMNTEVELMVYQAKKIKP